MEILKVGKYRDGGTVFVKTTEGTYEFDGKIGVTGKDRYQLYKDGKKQSIFERGYLLSLLKKSNLENAKTCYLKIKEHLNNLKNPVIKVRITNFMPFHKNIPVGGLYKDMSQVYLGDIITYLGEDYHAV